MTETVVKKRRATVCDVGVITRGEVTDSPAEVGQLVVEDDSGARRVDL